MDETESSRGLLRMCCEGALVERVSNARHDLVDVITKLEAGWPMRRVAEPVLDRWARESGLLTQREQAR